MIIDMKEADFKNGMSEGKGIYYYVNSDKFEGDWKNGKLEENGIFYYNNGDKQMYHYFKGNMIWKHFTFKINGKILNKIY